MPKFSALVHIDDGHSGLEQTLESLGCANDILVIVDESGDEYQHIRKLVSKHGGRTKSHVPGVSAGAYAMDAYYDWVLVLRPGEQLDQSCVPRLCEWQNQKDDDTAQYSVIVRSGEQLEDSFRLVNRRAINWTGDLPPQSSVPNPIRVAA